LAHFWHAATRRDGPPRSASVGEIDGAFIRVNPCPALYIEVTLTVIK
jgi:hypothetical protein